jgi:thiamine-monophosphate kinase
LKASGNRGAQIQPDQVPLFEASVALLGSSRALELALGGGDDYELCFTAPEERYQEVNAIGGQLGRDIFCIGRVTEEGGCQVEGGPANLKELSRGYQHTWTG